MEKLRKILNKSICTNENLQNDNEKYNKQVVKLVGLLQAKDSKLSFYVENHKFMKLIDKFSVEKYLSNLLKLILRKRINMKEYIQKYLFRIWRIKSTFINRLDTLSKDKLNSEMRKKVNLEIVNSNFYFIYKKINSKINLEIVKSEFNFIYNKIRRKVNFKIEKSDFYFHCENISKLQHSETKQVYNEDDELLFENFNFNYMKVKSQNYNNRNSLPIEFINKLNFITSISKKLNNNLSTAFYKILKFSYFTIIKSKMIIFKNILINKKLKYFIKSKYLNVTRFYFNNFKKLLLKNISNSISDPNIGYKKLSILIRSKIIKEFSSNNTNVQLNNKFLKWRNSTLIVKLQSIEELLNSFKNIEEEFTSKLVDIEKTYEDNIEKIILRNKELENQLKESRKEVDKYKSIVEMQESNIEELSEMVQANRDDNQMIEMKNKINLLSDNYENELKSLRSENETLREKYEEYQQNYKEFEKLKNEKKIDKGQIKEFEKKILVFSSTNEKITIELCDVLKKYENLKIISAQTTEELIKTHNELTKIKPEIKNLNEAKNTLTETLDKLTNEINAKERSIRQLKLNEDTMNHQFKIEKDRVENKFNSEKNNLNEKIDLLDKEKELSKDQIKNLNKENKNLNEKLKTFFDYNNVKKENNILKDKIGLFENENDCVKIQNNNLQKQIDSLIENLACESKKYENTKLELEELKSLSQDSKEDLQKALEEMEGYAQLLVAFEDKIKEAEGAKIQAEKEREEAIEEVKKIRQRYINILDNKSF